MPFRRAAVRLERIVHGTLRGIGLLDDNLGRGKAGVDVAARKFVRLTREIAGRRGMHTWSPAPFRRVHIDHRHVV